MTTKQHRWGLKVERLTDSQQKEADDFMKFLHEKGVTYQEISNLTWRNIREYDTPAVIILYRKKLGIKYEKVIDLSGSEWYGWCRESAYYGPFVFYKTLPIAFSKIKEQRRGSLFTPVEIEAKIQGTTPVEIEPTPAPVLDNKIESLFERVLQNA